MGTAFIAFAALGAIAGFSSSAKAIDAGQCFSMPEWTAAMKSEQQRSLVYGDEVFTNTARVFTLNADGSVGYISEGDAPMPRQSAPSTQPPLTRMCVSRRLVSVKLLDARKPGVSPDAEIAGDPQIAAQQCGTNPECKPHNAALAMEDQNGTRVMLQCTLVSLQNDKTYKPVSILTLSGTLSDKPIPLSRGGTAMNIGALSVSSFQGASIMADYFSNLAYTPYALTALNEKR